MNETTIRGIGTFVTPKLAGVFPLQLRRALVVDDDPAVRRVITRILDTSGYEVDVACDGHEAMQKIADNPPDFLLTDWDMPEYNGLGLCGWIRERSLTNYIYTILITGNSSTKHMVQAISAGADDFMSKPIQPGELLARLQAGQRIIELQQQLSFLATHDQLTGLLSRRLFFEILEQQFRQAIQQNRPLACVMIDIDCFKSINDEYGHQIGDDVLAAVAGVLKQRCRASDSICRYGGEEFCALLLDCDLPEALQWTERCRSAIADTPCNASERTIHLTASFGISSHSHNPNSAKQLLNMADSALLLAKRSGKNRMVVFNNGPL